MPTLDEFKKMQAKFFEERVKVMKIARDILWTELEKCDSLLEAQNLLTILGQNMEMGFMQKKKDTKVSSLDLMPNEKSKSIIKQIGKYSVEQAEKAVSSLAQMLDVILKSELKDRKLESIEKSKIFYTDDKVFEEKRAELDRKAEEEYAKMENKTG